MGNLVNTKRTQMHLQNNCYHFQNNSWFQPGPRHGEVPPRGESKSAAPPSYGLKQSQAFRTELFHYNGSSGWR